MIIFQNKMIRGFRIKKGKIMSGFEGPPEASQETPQDSGEGETKEAKHEKFVSSSIPKAEMDKQVEKEEQKVAEEKEIEARKALEAREQREYNRRLQIRKQGEVGDITNSKAERILKVGDTHYSVYAKRYPFRENIDWSNITNRELGKLQEEYEIIPNYKSPTY